MSAMRTELNFEEGMNLITTLPESGLLRVEFFIRHCLEYPEDAQKLARYFRFCAAHLDSLAEIMQKKGGSHETDA